MNQQGKDHSVGPVMPKWFWGSTRFYSENGWIEKENRPTNTSTIPLCARTHTHNHTHTHTHSHTTPHHISLLRTNSMRDNVHCLTARRQAWREVAAGIARGSTNRAVDLIKKKSRWRRWAKLIIWSGIYLVLNSQRRRSVRKRKSKRMW